jgi:hypothetical protein
MAEWRRDLELQEMQSLEHKLKKIENKLSRSQSLHESQVKRIQSEARLKNQRVSQVHDLHMATVCQ